MEIIHLDITVVSRIYAPLFATLALVENVGGAYMWDLTFHLANTPPLPVPRIDVDILILQKPAGHVATLVCLVLQKLEYLLVKID